ncbi:MAG: FAD-dependent oxidoreductase [Pseudomonadota bacterium]
MNITVIGAGIMGLSVARAALKAGHAVTVLEQSAIPNEAGSSIDESRLIQHAYGGMQGYARLVDPAFEAWDRLWDDLETNHYRQTGTLCVAEGQADWIDASQEGLTRLGLKVDRLDRAELAARFTPLDPPDGSWGIHVAAGGTLAARDIVRDLARWLATNGAVLRADTKVVKLDLSSGTCHLAEGGTVEGDKLVVAAGPWSSRLIGAEVRLAVSRHVSVMAEIPRVHASAWADMPMMFSISEGSIGNYWVPPSGSGQLTLGDHAISPPGDPDADRLIGGQERSIAFARGAGWLRAPELYDVKSGRACYYTMTMDERFVVRPLADRVWAMAGFSGHGFKFGPLLGEQVVAAIDGKISTESVSEIAAGH